MAKQLTIQQTLEQSDPDFKKADDGAIISDDDKVKDVGAKKKVIVQAPVEEETDETAETEEESEEIEPTYKKDQVQQIVQTRVNTLNKRIERLDGYKKAVDRICEITGLDFNKLLTNLEGMTLAEQAKVLNVPVEQVKQVRETRALINKETGVNQSLQRQLDTLELKKHTQYQDIDLFKEEIDDLMIDNPKLSLKQAYLLVKGDSAIVSAVRDTEQRLIAKRVNDSAKQVLKPTGSATLSTPKLTQEVQDAAKMAGMDPVEYVKYQGISNIDQYRALKKPK